MRGTRRGRLRWSEKDDENMVADRARSTHHIDTRYPAPGPVDGLPFERESYLGAVVGWAPEGLLVCRMVKEEGARCKREL